MEKAGISAKKTRVMRRTFEAKDQADITEARGLYKRIVLHHGYFGKFSDHNVGNKLFFMLIINNPNYRNDDLHHSKSEKLRYYSTFDNYSFCQ